MMAPCMRAPRLAIALPLLFAAAFPPACSAGAASTRSVTFDAERAWSHLAALVALGPRHCGSEAIEKARVYFESRLAEAGLEPIRESFVAQDTPAGDVPMCNVYCDLLPAGGAADAPLLILASHYDTKRLGPAFVGANDGGSSTAVLLELARQIAADPPERMAVRFLFLDGEEAFNLHWSGDDNTYGSRHHAAAIRANEALFKRLKAFVLLDLVGERGLRLSTDTHSTLALRKLFFEVARENGLTDIVGGREQEINDDHMSFRKIGIDAIDLIDLDYEWWHQDGDTLDKCAKESLARIGKLVLCALPALQERYAPSAGPVR